MFTLSIKRGVGKNNTSLVEFYYPPSDDPRFQILSGQFEQELNGAGQLTFTIAKSSAVYDEIEEMHSEIILKQDGTEYWRGRVISTEIDYTMNKTVTCEGILNYLLDTYVSPKELAALSTPVYEGSTASVKFMFDWYITKHNEKVVLSTEESKTYRQMNVNWTELNADWGSDNYITTGADDYPSTLDQILDDLIEENGGYLWVDGGTNVIHYRKNLTTSNVEQYIAFEENMLDYVETLAPDDENGFWTALIPLGKSSDDGSGHSTRLDISSVMNRNYLLKTDLPTWTGGDETAKYGMIFHIETFDDVEDATKLKEEGLKFLADHVNLPQTFTIKAVDRSFYTGADPLKVGQVAHILSAPHGISRNDVVLSAVSLDLLNPANCDYTFGDLRSTLTKKQYRAAKAASTATSKAQNASSSAKEAKEAAASISLSMVDGENETAELVNAGGA